MADPTAAPAPGGRTVLVLGSASPARATLLRNAGIPPVVQPSGIDEDAVIAGFGEQAGDPAWLTQQLARSKALDVAEAIRSGAVDVPPGRVLVVGADSMLAIDGRVLGKARSAQEVRDRWAAMAGGVGALVTGHTLVDVAAHATVEATCTTRVRFGLPDPVELEAYIASGEPLAVAGSCTIDGLGGAFIDGIEGDHTNVIGLALPTLRRLVGQLGVRWTDLWDRPEGPRQPGSGSP